MLGNRIMAAGVETTGSRRLPPCADSHMIKGPSFRSHMNPQPPAPPQRARRALLALVVVLPIVVGCTGLLQNLGAKWVTRQIAAEFNLDEAQTAETRASVQRLMAAAPAALSSKVDMLVATVDVALAKGFTEEKLIGMERQVDKIVDIVAGAIIDEASPILATLRDDQIDFADQITSPGWRDDHDLVVIRADFGVAQTCEDILHPSSRYIDPQDPGQ